MEEGDVMSMEWTAKVLIKKLVSETYEKEKAMGLYDFLLSRGYSENAIKVDIGRKLNKKYKNAKKYFDNIGFYFECPDYDEEQKEKFLRWYLKLEENESIDFKRNGIENKKNSRKILYNVVNGKLEDDYWNFAKYCIEQGNGLLHRKVTTTFPGAQAVKNDCIKKLRDNQSDLYKCYYIILDCIKNGYNTFSEIGDKIECYMMCDIASSLLYFWYRHLLQNTENIWKWNKELVKEVLKNTRRILHIEINEKQKRNVNIFEDFALCVLVAAHKNEIEDKKEALQTVYNHEIGEITWNGNLNGMWMFIPDNIDFKERKRIILGDKEEKNSRFRENCEKVKKVFDYLVEKQYLYESHWCLLTEKILYDSLFRRNKIEQKNSNIKFSTMVGRIVNGKYDERDDLHIDLFYLAEYLVKIQYMVLGKSIEYEEYFGIKQCLLELEKRVLRWEKGELVNPHKMLIKYWDYVAYVPEIFIVV